MTKRDAYKLGVASGYEAGIYGRFPNNREEDQFMDVCNEICMNKRQFADSPTYSFNSNNDGSDRAMWRTEGLYDSFDEGETIGIRKAWRKRNSVGNKYNEMKGSDLGFNK